jgi:hypothetical protein
MLAARRPIALFALRTAAVLLACLLPWPGLGRAYSSAFVSLASETIGGLRTGSGLVIDFERIEDVPQLAAPAVGPWHAVLVVRNPVTDKATRSAMNLRSLAYLPWSIFLALTVGAPIRRSREWLRSVGIGAALTGAFVCLSIGVAVLSVITSGRIQAIEVGSTTRSLILSAFFTVCEINFVIVATIWFVARRIAMAGDDWLFLRPRATQNATQPARANEKKGAQEVRGEGQRGADRKASG